jgi:hypothetical protein
MKLLEEFNVVVYPSGDTYDPETGKKINHVFDPSGYRRIYRKINGKRRGLMVHRLVAIAYIPNPHNKPDVNHLDGDKGNCAIENLQWVTEKENTQHAIASGLWNPITSGKMPRNIELVNDYNSGMTKEELEAKYGLRRPGVNRILSLYA